MKNMSCPVKTRALLRIKNKKYARGAERKRLATPRGEVEAEAFAQGEVDSGEDGSPEGLRANGGETVLSEQRIEF